MWDLVGRVCLKFWSNFHAEPILKASELGERVQSTRSEEVLPVVPFNREKTEHLKSHLILEKCGLSSFGFIRFTSLASTPPFWCCVPSTGQAGGAYSLLCVSLGCR